MKFDPINLWNKPYQEVFDRLRQLRLKRKLKRDRESRLKHQTSINKLKQLSKMAKDR